MKGEAFLMLRGRFSDERGSFSNERGSFSDARGSFSDVGGVKCFEGTLLVSKSQTFLLIRLA